MWLLPKIKNNHLFLVLHPDRITCATFAQEGARSMVQAFRSEPCAVVDDSLLYDSRGLQARVLAFISDYNLTNAYVTVLLGKHLLHESIVDHPKYGADLSDIVPVPLRHIFYSHTYLGPVDDQGIYYLCTISQALMLQIKIACHSLPLHMRAITGPFSAQIAAYIYLAGKNFSSVRLAQEVDRAAVMIPSVWLSTDAPHNRVQHDCIDIGDASFLKEDIMLAWGSCVGEYV